MKFSVKKVVGIDYPSKRLILKDGVPLIFVNSQSRASSVIQYLEGYKTDEQFLEEMNWNKHALDILRKAKE